MWSKNHYTNHLPILMVLINLWTNLSLCVSAQTAIDLKIGELYKDTLSGNGDLRYYRIPCEANKKIFVLVNKTSRYRAYLSIKEGGLPERGTYSDYTDQAVELQGQTTGYCYVRVEKYYAYGDPDTGSFSITAHDQNTFPKLTMGQILSNQELKWDGDAQWYQLPLKAGEKSFVLLDKNSRFRSLLAIREGGLPDKGSYSDLTDQAVELQGQTTGYCYVRVEKYYAYGDPDAGSFSITAHDQNTFPKLTMGQILSNQELKWDGDAQWYQLPLKAGEKSFVLLDKNSRFRSLLAIREGGLPDKGSYSDLTDQAVELQGQTTGYCYVRVEKYYAYGDPDAGSFSITAHDQNTFPKLTMGQILSNQELKWDGDAQWYQLPLKAGEKSFVLLDKNSRFRSLLAIREGGLPDKGSYSDLTDQAVELLGQAAGYCYVRIEKYYAYGDPDAGSFSITAHDQSTFPKLTMGQILSNQELKWDGDAQWYQLPLKAGEKSFVLLDKNSRFRSLLAIREGGLPDKGSYSDLTDQAVELQGQTTGYCYVRVEKYYAYGDPDTGSFSITAHDQNTFPKLTMGQILSNQELKWDGDKKWHQLKLDKVTPLVIHVMKTAPWNGSLNFKSGGLPIEQPYQSTTGDGDLIINSFNTQIGTYYINVTSNSGNLASYAISADTSISQKEIIFNEWQDINLYRNSQKIFKTNVPANTGNLYFLVRKSTKIGHHGTWDGRIRIFREGTLLAEESGMLDFDAQFKNAPGGKYYAEIWANDDAAAQIKICDHLDQLTLGEWHKGIVLKGWGHDWTQVDIPTGVDTLFFVTQGFGVYSNMNVYFDSLDNKTDHWYFDNWQHGYDLKGKIIKPKAGRYIFKYEDSDNVEGSDSQKRDYLLKVDIARITDSQAQKPLIYGLSTYEVGQGEVTFSIFGKGLDSISNVFLMSSQHDLIEQEYICNNSSTEAIYTHFNFGKANTGLWQVGMRKKNGIVNEYPYYLKITEDTIQSLKVNILGRSQIRLGREQSYLVECSNNGKVDYSGNIVFKSDRIIDYSLKLFNNDSIIDIEPISYNGPVVLTIIGLPPGFTQKAEIKVKLSSYNLPYSKSTNDDIFDCIGKVSIALEVKDAFMVGRDAGIIAENTGKYVEEAIVNGGLVPWETTVYTIKKAVLEYIIGILKRSPGGWIWNFFENGLRKELDKNYPNVSKDKINNITNEVMQNMKDDILDQTSTKYSALEACPVGSSTPEDKFGTTGYDSPEKSTTEIQRFVSKNDAFTYRIDFWNKETATAPAQEVFIWDTLDTKLDESTLNFTEFGFLRWTTPLKGGQYFNVNVDMQPDMNLIVNVEGKYDPNSREIKWTFRSLDPITMELTEDPLAGFLPPIDTSGYQIGWVEYKIKPFNYLSTGTTITNQAWVNFDGVGPTNPAPNKAPWLNTIDAIAPVSEVNPAITHLDTNSYRLTWYGEDDEGGSGIASYSIYVSDNSNTYKLLISNTSDTSAIFTGEYGHNYMFYSIACDGTGNIEMAPTGYDAILMVTSIDDKELKKQDNILNLACHPNPFNNSTEISFSLPGDGKVLLQLYDYRGALVRILANSNQVYGPQLYRLDNESLPEGIYFVKLIYNNSKEDISHSIKIIKYE